MKLNKTEKIMAVVGIIVIVALMGRLFVEEQSMTEGIYPTMTLHYDDGTTRTLDNGLSTPTMELVDPSTGKVVVKIDVSLHMVTEFEGAVNSYSVSGSMAWSLYTTSGALITDLGSPRPISVNGGILMSGEDVIVFSDSADTAGSGIQDYYGGWVDGQQYVLKVRPLGSITVTLYFGVDSTPLSRTATPASIGWTFKYNAPFSFTSLSMFYTGIPTYSPYY